MRTQIITQEVLVHYMLIGECRTLFELSDLLDTLEQLDDIGEEGYDHIGICITDRQMASALSKAGIIKYPGESRIPAELADGGRDLVKRMLEQIYDYNKEPNTQATP
jgi:hypothetical protein